MFDNTRTLIDRLLRQHGARPQYYPHLRSSLFHCHGDVAAMEHNITQFYKNCRRWFF
jgi:hypothetical protein